MAWIPSSAILHYNQYQSNENIVVRQENSNFSVYGPPINMYLSNLPSWLTYSNMHYDASQQSIVFTLQAVAAVANNLDETEYNATIVLNFQLAQLNFSYNWEYNVLLIVNHDTLLEVSPTTLSFQYTIGDSTPQNQSVSVSTSEYWSAEASQSWVTLSPLGANGNSMLTVGVDPSGLAVGQYQAIITIIDGFSTKFITVNLNVNEGDTDTDYLYITPTNLQFISEVGVENTTEKLVTLDASHAWTATTSETWLEVSAASGSSGSQQITVTVDTVALEDTSISYLGQITFVCQGIQKIVYVELILVEFLLQGLENDTLYFADDRNKLTVTNVYNNMYLQLHTVAATGQNNVPYIIEAPYQAGYANAIIGLETNVLLKSVGALTNLTSGVRNRIKPITLGVSAYNKNKSSGATALIASYFGLKFLPGNTPEVENKLCYLPDTIFMSKQGVVSLTALAQVQDAPVSMVAYDENAQFEGGEWDTAPTGSIQDDNTDESSDGTTSIYFPTSTIGQSMYLIHPEGVELQGAVLQFKFKQPTIHDYNFQLRLYDSGSGQNYPQISITGNAYGLDPNSTEWQTVAIPITNVGLLDSIRFLNYSNASAFHIDEVEIITTAVSYYLDDSDIVITGDVEATIATAINPSLYMYNALVNLASLELEVGHHINIAFAGLSVNVVIEDDSLDSHMIAFENEWKEYEFFECRGTLTESESASKTTTQLQVEGKKHTKTVSIDAGEEYILNTGNIVTEEEARWFKRILKSKRVFIYINGTPVEVDLTTKKLDFAKTRENLRSYSINFTKAII